MPKIIVWYVRAVDAINYRIGRIAMWLIFAMIGILLYSSISKTFFNPSLFTFDLAQFLMVSYFLLGGPYAMLSDLRVNGPKMELTSIPDDEWATVEAAARVFWDEIAAESELRDKVVNIFKDYNQLMENVGRPYRYS